MANTDNLGDQIVDLLSNGGTLGDTLDYERDDYETIYTLGYDLYNQGRYSDAMKAFGFLVMHDHWETKYAKAFASSLQMLGRYQDAIQFYSTASLMDLSDPVPTFHTAECMIPLGMLKEAREALEMVLRQCKGKAERKELAERSQALLAMLEADDEKTAEQSPA